MYPDFQAAPFPYVAIPLNGGPLGFFRSVQMMRQLKPQLIHTHYRRATALARRLQSHRSPPLLYTVHLSHMSMNWWRKPLTDFGDETHVAAEEAAKWVIDSGHVPARRVNLVSHGIDVHRYQQRTPEQRTAARAALGLPPDATIAVFVGRFDDPKNEDWLLDLAPLMPELRIMLVGGGPHEQALRARVEQMGIASRVQILGYQDPLPIYQAADALLLPSLREGFGLACGEAMSVGVPVLRTRTSGTLLQIVENVTGRSTDIDHDAFIAAAKDFLGDRDRLARMGEAAARHVREKFPFELQLTGTIDLYRRLIEQAKVKTARNEQ
jgi:glycosyltransferase involved in cell wall biosynthesis